MIEFINELKHNQNILTEKSIKKSIINNKFITQDLNIYNKINDIKLIASNYTDNSMEKYYFNKIITMMKDINKQLGELYDDFKELNN